MKYFLSAVFASTLLLVSVPVFAQSVTPQIFNVTSASNSTNVFSPDDQATINGSNLPTSGVINVDSIAIPIPSTATANAITFTVPDLVPGGHSLDVTSYTTGQQSTYSISSSVSPTIGGVVFQLQGSATKIVHIKRVTFNALSTTASGASLFYLIKTTTASAGTSPTTPSRSTPSSI